MFLKRVYIKKVGDEIASEACFAAWKGFSHKAYPLDFFEWEDLKHRRLVLDRSTLVVGGTVVVHTALQQIGIEIPQPLNLPDCLATYAGRRIWTATLGELRKDVCEGRGIPVFVKPLIETKTFAGRVITGEKDLLSFQHFDDKLALQAAEPVQLVAEWRYYVHQNHVVGLAHYKGDCFIVPDSSIVRKAVADYTTAPIAYALDFGVSADGRTLLIEANDSFSLGSYGLDSVAYANMLEDRWLELVGAISRT
jgi:hypothetical protein